MNREQSILSVAQLNQYIRMQMDGDAVLSDLLVRGEVSNLKYHSSGHIYFTLKDAEGQLKSVMFRSYADKIAFRLQDGMRVIAHGRVSVYSATGQYQLYADDMQPDGVGSLALQFEQLKQKLSAEGLFDAERKKPLPKFPTRIGVITSPTGAAIRDILNILNRRFPLARVILFPALVQGEEAPAHLIAGLHFFESTELADVIIIGRGGGSMEDLWAFNNEELARTVATCKIPVISAVGHETDFTICDFVADCRAPTPSAAAEIAVPDQGELKQYFASVAGRMGATLSGKIQREKKYLNQIATSGIFRKPEMLLDPFRMKLADAETKLLANAEQYLQNTKHRLAVAGGKLDALSPLRVLSRGYAVATKNGDTVHSVAQLKTGEDMEILFSDGTVTATVKEIGGNHG